MAVSTASTLNVTVAHAVAYLTRPLILSYSATTIIRLQLVLEANLIAAFAPTWVTKEPLRGSGRRCLTLSPSCLPPRVIYNACLAANVQWFDWIAVLGGREFDLFIDPGCISVRFGKKNSGAPLVTIWSDDAAGTVRSRTSPTVNEAKVQAQLKAQADARAPVPDNKTLAQQLLEEDKEEDDQLFALIADEVSAPTWITPILDQFPFPARSASPAASTHSRSSSSSSDSSSGFSFTSSAETITSYGSLTSVSSAPSSLDRNNQFKTSRRERARQARVYVDTSKTEVTPYDGGKTTVLTGGVMLGAGPSSTKGKKVVTKPVQSMQSPDNWRTARA